MNHAITLIVLAAVPFATAAPAGQQSAGTPGTVPVASTFFNAGPSEVPDAKLPAEGFHPRGRKLLYAGYSGKPERDLANGFTVVGPSYGTANVRESLAAIAAGRPCIVQVGVHGANSAKGIEAASRMGDEEIRRVVAEDMRRYLDAEAVAKTTAVVWWSLEPEELRPWRPDEMRFLRVAADTIRETDPLRRPVFLYNPNHRDATTLAPIAGHVDILAKGCYVNSAGYKECRGWIRYSVEQMLEAARAVKRPQAVVVMPELCKDPDPGDLGKIEAWVRHDVYLGLMSGAKGMLTWSLHPRKEVKATWQRWYDTYAAVGRELNGPGGLAPVFLAGEKRSDLAVTPLADRAPTPIAAVQRSSTEANTSKASESAKGVLHAWTAVEYVYDGAHYLFLANSHPEPTPFRIAGFPAKVRIARLPSGAILPEPIPGAPIETTLAPWEILILKFTVPRDPSSASQLLPAAAP